MQFPNPSPMFIPAILWLASGGWYIQFLKNRMMGQYIREDGPQSHHKKAGTPTMGGLLILATVVISLLGFIVVHRYLVTPALLLSLLVMTVFGALGFSDDFLKITKKKNKGLSGWAKLAIQVFSGLLLGLYMLRIPGDSVVSFFGHGQIDLRWFYPLLTIFMLTGSSNAFNLTDGLDGLAGGAGFMTFIGFAFLLGQTHPELVLFSLLLAGGCLGFLVFNRYPARIFMGDTGSLALGGVMASFAILGKVELYLLFLGGLYIVETLSVILQVAFFKATHGKRLFKMSPLHHHFELSGWKEQTVVLTFIFAQLLLSVLAILLYNKTQ
jgi:phospho-N-acetylmuramoyl-pentapeptide-transferase